MIRAIIGVIIVVVAAFIMYRVFFVSCIFDGYVIIEKDFNLKSFVYIKNRAGFEYVVKWFQLRKMGVD